jgi:SAM-dependent methyltransferase
MTDPRTTAVGRGYDAMGEAFDVWRDRIVGDPRGHWLKQLLARVPEGARVLELGCGSGTADTPLLADRFELTGVDISPRQVERATRNVPGARFLVADLTSVELEDGSFDAVAAFYAFNHVPRDLLASTFARIRRWLAPGGYFLASLGESDLPGWYGEFVGAPSYFSSYPPDVNRRLLRDAGFEVLLNEIVTFTEPDGEGRFQWVLAQR